MFGQKIAVAALSVLAVVSAQSQNFTINPNDVDINTRASWCTSQRNNCDTICAPARANNCNPSTLDFTCTCASGQDPKLDSYEGTMPFFICKQAYNECNLEHVGDKKGQDDCTSRIDDKCGSKVPGKDSTSTPAISSSGSGSSATPTGDSSPASTSKSAPKSSPTEAAAAMLVGPQHLGLVAAGVLAVMV